MRDLLQMDEKEQVHLAWIHSNKFTIPELFHKKFLPGQSLRNAYKILNKYTSPEKGFLHLFKTPVANSNLFFLTAGAIRTLDHKERMLVRSIRYPVKVNPHEREHDLKVQALRIVLEASQELGDVFSVSDFEMRSGITPSIKAEYLAGKLDKVRWRANSGNPNQKWRRTPDGYFEADLEGRRLSFALEFENLPYSEKVMERMVDNLGDAFPRALKLIVTATPKNAVRMIKSLQSRIKSEEQSQWFVSDYGRVIEVPFKKCWHHLNRPLLD